MSSDTNKPILTSKRTSSGRQIKHKVYNDDFLSELLPHSQQKKSLADDSTSGGNTTAVRYSTRGTQRKGKKLKASTTGISQMGKWKPEDDLALITAVVQSNDLAAVYLGIQFSSNFSLREIQERWYTLLYDPVISRLAQAAMRQLHPEIITQIQAKTLYSKNEESLLKQIPSSKVKEVNLDTFRTLLKDNPAIFHHGRTPASLLQYWHLLRNYNLLSDQKIAQTTSKHNFDDAVKSLNDNELMQNVPPLNNTTFSNNNPSSVPSGSGTFLENVPTHVDDILDQEFMLADRHSKRHIRHLEMDLKRFTVLCEPESGDMDDALSIMNDIPNDVFAILRGRLVRFSIKCPEVKIGRATPMSSTSQSIQEQDKLDIDVSLEGPAWRISRRQALLKLDSATGDFIIRNEGQRPIFVDGKPIVCGTQTVLLNEGVLEIDCLRFIFTINAKAVEAFRNNKPLLSTTTTITNPSNNVDVNINQSR